jgi:hypothetical protein
MHYEPIPQEGLKRLKEDLAFNNVQMAAVFGIATGRQFHKYLSEGYQRPMGFHVLMYGMAQVELMAGPIVNIEQLYDRARKYGAVINLESAGEQDSSPD